MSTKTMKIGLSDSDKASMQAAITALVKASLITAYSSSATYALGDFVYNGTDGKFYKCTTAITTAESWTSAHWSEATLNDVISAVNAAVASVENKVDPDDICPNLRAGFSFLADNFNTKLVYNDNLAYNFRTTAGGEEVASQIKQKAIIGGSLGWNQLVQNGNFANADNWTVNGGSMSVNNNKATITWNGTQTEYYSNRIVQQNVFKTANHKYLISMTVTSSFNTQVRIGIYITSGLGVEKNVTANTKTVVQGIINATSVDTMWLQLDRNLAATNGSTTVLENVFVIDLTACFGPTIADYIYNLEVATAGAGLAWFRRYFPKPYYPYHAIGGFVHVQTKGKKYVMFNQFAGNSESNPQYIGHYYIDNQGNKNAESNFNCFRVRVLPNTSYCICKEDGAILSTVAHKRFVDSEYAFVSNDITGWDATKGVFTTPSGCMYMEFSLSKTLATGVCINLHWDGERDGEYEAYKENVYDVDPIEIIGIPKIDAQGNLYFEGNRYNSDGNVEEEWYEYTFTGQETFSKRAEGNGYDSYFTSSDALPVRGPANLKDTVICSNGYFGSTAIYSAVYNGNVQGVGIDNTQIYLSIPHGSDPNLIFPAGTKMIYRRAAPTTSEATPYSELQIGDNWGTEDFLPPDDDTRPVEVPVGNDTDYLPDLKAKLETAPANPDTDGDYVMHRESGENSYTPIGAWLTANGWFRLDQITGYDATKTQSLKNVEGTLTWVDD